MRPTKDKIVSLTSAKDLVLKWRTLGKKIVFTNGCFDLLHPGHIDYLEKARNLGDKLVVALNANVSVKKLKGENRPIFDELSRAEMLAALQFVDVVLLFDHDTPVQVIEELEPDILVKGADYKLSNIAGAESVMRKGGKVELINLKPGFSTSSIIEKVKTLNS